MSSNHVYSGEKQITIRGKYNFFHILQRHRFKRSNIPQNIISSVGVKAVPPHPLGQADGSTARTHVQKLFHIINRIHRQKEHVSCNYGYVESPNDAICKNSSKLACEPPLKVSNSPKSSLERTFERCPEDIPLLANHIAPLFGTISICPSWGSLAFDGARTEAGKERKCLMHQLRRP